jgi:uncharacterized tellurite resistance protein B-like protein
MYSALKGLVDTLTSPDSKPINMVKEDPKVILGVLFLTVVRIDGRVKPEETSFYNLLVEGYLKIAEDERVMFENEVAKRLRSDLSLERLTDELKTLPSEKRFEIVELLNQISISDRELHEAELSFVAHVTRLLEVES